MNYCIRVNGDLWELWRDNTRLHCVRCFSMQKDGDVPDIQGSINRLMVMWLDEQSPKPTYPQYEPNKVELILTPKQAIFFTQNKEVQTYLNRARFGLEMLMQSKNFEKYGCPDAIYGIPIRVEEDITEPLIVHSST